MDVAAGEGSIVEVALRYKQPDGDESVEFTTSLDASATGGAFGDAGREFRFAAAVAEFAEILRGSEFAEGSDIWDVQEIAQDASGDKPERIEFIELVARAADML